MATRQETETAAQAEAEELSRQCRAVLNEAEEKGWFCEERLGAPLASIPLYGPRDVTVTIGGERVGTGSIPVEEPKSFNRNFPLIEVTLTRLTQSIVINGTVFIGPGCPHFRDRSARVRVWLPRACRPRESEQALTIAAASQAADQLAAGLDTAWDQRISAATRRLQRTLREWPACPVHGPVELEWRRSGCWCRRGFWACRGDG